ncbi:MAG TPA: hypothetical protein EYQ00_01310, partial [Dehalococcoidia bacterium]|nr:hypothetical protein [Dehalococcoidia bacterium]
MNVGDLVRFKVRGSGRNMVGFVMRVDEQHFGANTAYKISHVERGKCIRSNMVDMIAQTADGIRDRVLVLWSNEVGYEYCESTDIEVVSENS